MAVDCQNIYKNARKSAGMTQEKAAQLLNVSVDSLRDYEQSQRPPARLSIPDARTGRAGRSAGFRFRAA